MKGGTDLGALADLTFAAVAATAVTGAGTGLGRAEASPERETAAIKAGTKDVKRILVAN